MPELKPLPCPACGNEKLAVLEEMFHGLSHMVVCSCGLRGPKMLMPEAAIAAWNDLPRALTWATEPPKVAGFYWWICEQEQPDKPLMVLVDIDSAGKFSSFFIYGGEPSFHCCDKCRWAGPIVPPGE